MISTQCVLHTYIIQHTLYFLAAKKKQTHCDESPLGVSFHMNVTRIYVDSKHITIEQERKSTSELTLSRCDELNSYNYLIDFLGTYTEYTHKPEQR